MKQNRALSAGFARLSWLLRVCLRATGGGKFLSLLVIVSMMLPGTMGSVGKQYPGNSNQYPGNSNRLKGNRPQKTDGRLQATADVTGTPGIDEATPTAMPPVGEATATPTLGAPSPTATPEGEPPPTATFTPTPGAIIPTLPAPTATPTAEISPTPTLTVTATATPPAEIAPDEALALALQAFPSLVAPGETFTLTWSIDGWKDTFSGLEALIRLPSGFAPLDPGRGDFDSQASTYRLPVSAAIGEVGFLVGKEAAWPYAIWAELWTAGRDAPEAQAGLFLDGHWPADIGKEGGEVSAFGGQVRITFPAEALDEAIHVEVRAPLAEIVAEHALRQDGLASHLPFEVLAFSQKSGEAVRRFYAPLAIEIAYDPAQIQGDEGFLTLHYYDESQQAWLPLRSQVDLKAHRLVGYSDHLTIFDLDAQDWEAARLPTLKEFQVSSFTGAATYSFPIQVPPGPGGLQPNISLSYSSAAVDGASGDTQASWVGMGWSLDVGSIERNMHGTMRFLGDDTFTISTNGVSGLMLVGTDGNYHTADESFWRVKYDSASDTWTAWDKVGNVYYFGEGSKAETKARYPWYDPDECGTASHGYKGQVTYKWMLSRMVNLHGQQITYTYTKESKSVEGVCSDDPNMHDVATAIYPNTIAYPNNRYQISFQTINGDRLDRKTSWPSSNKLIFFMKSRLREIWVKQDADDNGSFETTVRKYVLTYTKDGGVGINPIFPNYTWEAGDKTLTLAKIQELGSDESPFPHAVTFGYTDNLHLTWANNGYQGQVEYSYAAWNEVDADQSRRIKQSFGPNGALCRDGTTAGWYAYGQGSSVVCTGDYYLKVTGTARKGLNTSLFHPGGAYLIYGEIAAVSGFTPYQLRFGLFDGQDNHWQTSPYPSYFTTTPDVYNSFTAIVPLPVDAQVDASTNVKLLIECTKCQVREFQVKWLPTYYRVTARTLRDTRTNDTSTTSYRYDGGATNDADHSLDVANTTDWDRYYQEYTEFRGHSMVQEVGPESTPGAGDSLVTTTFYHQDDEEKGRSSMTLVSREEFGESFDPIQTSTWSSSSGSFTTQRVDGDEALTVTESAGTWSASVRRATADITNREGALFLFRVSSVAGSAASVYSLEYGSEESNYRRWGIKVKNGGIYGHKCSDNNCTDQASAFFSGVQADTWYVALLIVDDNNPFLARVWKLNDPESARSFNESPGYTGLSWKFLLKVNANTVWLDAYSEGMLYSLTETIYDTNMTGLVGADPDRLPKIEGSNPVQRYDELNITWVRAVKETSLNFDGDAHFTGRQSETEYNPSEQGGTQYGNATRVYESHLTGSAFQRYRVRVSFYYPTVNANKYLTGLPGFVQQYATPGGVFDWGADDLRSGIDYLYDGASSYSTPPTTGKLTGQRTFLRWEGSEARYSDQFYTYDTWGNRTSTTVYSGEGTSGALATQGAQTTTITYDSQYHTYAIQETNALGQSIAMGYGNDQCTGLNGYRLGAPTSITDANNVATYACYDVFGRMTKIIRPGDTSALPTIEISYNDSASPFWTQVKQRLDGSAFFTIRKFYNGLGQKIQVQTAGAVLADNACSSDSNSDPDTCDVIVDTWYNAKGLARKQSAPYAVTAGSGYRSPASQPATTTTYDALGRTRFVTAPDGSDQEYQYPATPAESQYATYQETRYYDENNNLTRTLSDVWGRARVVIPPTGPSVTYTYDEADRLTQATRGGATTSLTYDQAGRKTQMVDPDMGTWYYTYDALGNLTRQRDAKNQRICFYYDALNRLLGKHYRSDDTCPSSPTYNVSYTYDQGAYGKGRRTSMSDSSGSTSWTYDNRGRVTQETKVIDGNSYTTQWGSYNSADLPTTMTYPGGEMVTFAYLPQKAINSVFSNTASVYLVKQTDYDAAGRVVRRGLGWTGSAFVLTTNYSYYAWTTQGGRLQTLQTGSLQNMTYTYDAAGNILTILDAPNANQKQCFTYDALNRLTKGTTYTDSAKGCTAQLGNGNYDENYYYDPSTGNLSSKGGVSYAYNDASHKHAVTHLGGVQKYWYDLNGNMTTRISGGSTYNFTYDAENRLTGVSGAATVSIVYDGDGNRVKATINGVTTVYVGNYYEKTGSVVKKHYYAGGARVALRDNGTSRFLLSDHLSGTNVTTTDAGAFYASLRYHPWGTVRYANGSTPTRYQYTGQYSFASEFGLLDYKSRYYDPYLNRWIQPDTIIPDQTNSQSWDRYAFVFNNPQKYIDPSGHRPCESIACNGETVDAVALVDSIKDDPASQRYWSGLTDEERSVLENAGWDEGSFNDHMTDQTSPADVWHDPLFYLELLTVGRGLVKVGMQMPELIVLPQLQVFRSGGESWHLGLETQDHMNLIHVGNHPEYGIHIAFGAVKPYVANFHIYLMNTFPFFRTWKP